MASIDEFIAARQEAVDLGLIEDSGSRRVNPEGESEIVWRVTRLGKLYGRFIGDGLTFDEAYVKAKRAVASPHRGRFQARDRLQEAAEAEVGDVKAMERARRAGRRRSLVEGSSTHKPEHRPLGLCLECCDYVPLSTCQPVDLRDGGSPLLGHMREGELCGPVFDEVPIGEDRDGLGVLELPQPPTS